jgi:hypothetical protein
MLKIGKQLSAFLEEGQKKYRRLRAAAYYLVLAFSLALGSIIGTSVPLNTSAVSQAAQSLIGVDGFLAAASGVIAFFYSGRLLEFASPSSPLMLAMRPIVNAESVDAKSDMEKSILAFVGKLDLSRTLDPKEVAQGQKAIFDAVGAGVQRIFEGSSRLVRDLAAPARRMAYYASFVLIVLIVSAFFSILGTLSGSAPLLGTAFGFTVLGSGFLALAWSDAHVNLIRFLASVLAHESMTGAFAPQAPQ